MNLTELMDAAERLARDFAKDAEIDHPILMMRVPGEDRTVIAPLLIDAPGEVQALLVREVIRATKPTMVVLINEAWMARIDKDTLPDRALRQRLAAGDMRVRDLPESLRQDALILTGETNEGECQDRWFVIHPGNPRTCELQPDPNVEGAVVTSRFRPLFSSDDERDKTNGRRPWSERAAMIGPEDV